MKWTCSHCGAINAELAFKCHNCPNTCGDEGMNKARTCHDKNHQFLITDLTERCNRLFLALAKAKELFRYQPDALEIIEKIETGYSPVGEK